MQPSGGWCEVVKDDGEVLVGRARWADDFAGHLRGLMFRRRLPAGEGLVLVGRRESRVDSAIHMLFVFFPIAAVFLDREGVVVDKRLARPWRPFYAPARPARYVLEADPGVLARVAVGERLEFRAHDA
jgi:uncharacterized membrane protein (UPF0127 family)